MSNSDSADPVIEKYEQERKKLNARINAKIAKHKQKHSKECISAKLAVMDFILDKGNHHHTIEGIRDALKNVTAEKDNGEKETWLCLFEKYLKNQRLRKIFGFPEIEKPQQ